jgi:hypothetical protein
VLEIGHSTLASSYLVIPRSGVHDGERGIFVATGVQKRDDLSLSPEHSI